MIGEGVEIFAEPVPASLVGKSLSSSEIGAKTGLNVIGIRAAGEFVANPGASTELVESGELLMLGTAEQHQRFLAMQSKS